jgi:hypothetical protein
MSNGMTDCLASLPNPPLKGTNGSKRSALCPFKPSFQLGSNSTSETHDYIPLAFNIHFAITFGYWIAKGVLGLDDVDHANGPEYDIGYEMLWGALIHGAPLAILLQKMIVTSNFDTCPYYFSPQTSYLWLWVWGLFVYTPWRIRTGDTVYSFMDPKTSVVVKIGGIVLVHGLLAISNVLGRYIHVVVANRY